MRKQPQQARSKTMVRDLIEAGTRVIAEDGLEAATTARIASRAGVSVGSLYQYFDRKEDIYLAVIEAITARIERIIDDVLEAKKGETLSEFVAELLRQIWDWMEEDNGLYLRVALYWNRLDDLGYIARLEQKVSYALAIFMVGERTNISRDSLPVRIYVFANAVTFNLLRYASSPPNVIERDDLFKSLVDLGEAFLRDSQA
ncbi:MAG: TetR/AcrR family transcriptional regulator [Pseudomonadota bacterium]